MRVHGLQGLRVVDASVFPYVTNGNIYAPMMMTAEKAADLILGNTPLRARAGAVLPPRADGEGGGGEWTDAASVGGAWAASTTASTSTSARGSLASRCSSSAPRRGPTTGT